MPLGPLAPRHSRLSWQRARQTQHVAGVAVLVVVPGHDLDEGPSRAMPASESKIDGVLRPRKSVATTFSSV
jgi:hypothetical protein